LRPSPRNKLVGPESCVGLGDSSGIKEGARVDVRDNNGRVVGTTTLSGGRPAAGYTECTWSSRVTVPTGLVSDRAVIPGRGSSPELTADIIYQPIVVEPG